MNSRSGKLLIVGVAVCALMAAMAAPAEAGWFHRWGSCCYTGWYAPCYTTYCPVACAPACDPCGAACCDPCWRPWRPFARLRARLASCCWGCYAPCGGCTYDACGSGCYDTAPVYGESYETESDTGPQMAPPEPPAADDAEGPQAQALPSHSGMIVLRVPADAKVKVNGHQTTSTGLLRRYVSTDLSRGSSYRYDIEVSMVRNGKTVTENRTVVLSGGTRRFVAVADTATSLHLASN